MSKTSRLNIKFKETFNKETIQRVSIRPGWMLATFAIAAALLVDTALSAARQLITMMLSLR